MANTQILRRRIKSAQNVSKSTKAMQMIAASKLKKAQDATFSSRPYVQKLQTVTASVRQNVQKDASHPYLTPQAATGKRLLVALSPDKGLCGGLITNLLREYAKSQKDDTLHVVVGKKIEHYVARLNKDLVASFPFGNTLPKFDMVYPIVSLINDYYLNKKVDEVYILYTEFVNVFTQKALVKQLLPLVDVPEEVAVSNQPFQLFEPNVQTLLPKLLSHQLEMTVYQYLLENYLSEQSARMLAMQNATDNAKDIIEALRLEYNKARQQKITSEILDISSAAIALQG
jgi:F-type H+-transporting ATPase subunit gamma